MRRMDGLHTLGRWTADRALAAALQRAGDRIATLAGNSADQVVLFFACAKAGLALADAALELLDKRPSVAVMGLAGLEARAPSPIRFGLDTDLRLVPRPVLDDDALLMLFTSGTEGPAKAAVLTHSNCFWNNLSLSRTLDLTSQDTVLAVLAQFLVGGWNIHPLLAWWTGATVVLERTFDAGRVLQLIADRKVTTTMGVPTHYLILATHPDFETTDLSTLRLAVVGGAPMPANLFRCWHKRGVSLVQGYGLTEAGPNVLCLASEDAAKQSGYAGKPYPQVEVKIVDRIKDIYISGGENVSPTEVEQVLLAHPGVAEAAVVGVADERWGEVGAAYLVLHPGVHVGAEDLVEHCPGRLARFKIPATFHFVTELPRTGLEKVSRAPLRGARSQANLPPSSIEPSSAASAAADSAQTGSNP